MKSLDNRYPIEIWTQDSNKPPLVFDFEEKAWGLPVGCKAIMSQGMSLSHITRCYVRVNANPFLDNHDLAKAVASLGPAMKRWGTTYPNIGKVQSFTADVMERDQQVRDKFLIQELTDEPDLPIVVIHDDNKYVFRNGRFQRTEISSHLVQGNIHCPSYSKIMSNQLLQAFVKQYIDCFICFEGREQNIIKYNYAIMHHRANWCMLDYI